MKNGNFGSNVKFGFVQDSIKRPHRRNLTVVVILLALMNLLASNAVADEKYLLVNGKAIHFNVPANTKLNESNWGLGFQYDWELVQNRWIPFAMASGLNDSNYNPSYYVGGGALHRFQAGTMNIDVGVIGFVMTRKKYKNDEPFLGVLPAFSMGTNKVAVNMTYVPKVDPKMVPLLFFQLKVNLSVFR